MAGKPVVRNRDSALARSRQDPARQLAGIPKPKSRRPRLSEALPFARLKGSASPRGPSPAKPVSPERFRLGTAVAPPYLRVSGKQTNSSPAMPGKPRALVLKQLRTEEPLAPSGGRGPLRVPRFRVIAGMLNLPA